LRQRTLAFYKIELLRFVSEDSTDRFIPEISGEEKFSAPDGQSLTAAFLAKLDKQLSTTLLLSSLFGFHNDYRYLPEMDNIYQEGIFICAKVAPDRRLVIDRYYKRIYYCKPVDDPSDKLLVYFERELTLPTL
jgi:hypothetical protein